MRTRTQWSVRDWVSEGVKAVEGGGGEGVGRGVCVGRGGRCELREGGVWGLGGAEGGRGERDVCGRRAVA